MSKNKTDKIVDFEQAKRIKETVQKIKDLYKDDDEGLNRLADKLRIHDDIPENNKTHENTPPCVKGNGIMDTDISNDHGQASRPDAPDDQNQE